MGFNWRTVFHHRNLKLILQLLLFGLFLQIFGFPSLQRYLDKKVLLVTSLRDTDGLEAPAVTVLVRGNKTMTGWKPTRFMYSNFVEYFCTDPMNKKNQTITACIEEKTYNRTEISKKVALGVRHWSRPVNVVWVEDFTHSVPGRKYTFKMSNGLRVGKLSDMLRISFQPNLQYSLYLHDERYFYISLNPESAPPSVHKIVDPGMLPYYYRLGLTEVEELNLPNDPCNEDPEYNFNACVKETFSKRAGCKTKWDDGWLKDLPLCTEMSQFR